MNFQPGDTVLVLSGMNKGVRAIFRRYNDRGKALCCGSAGAYQRITIAPEKLKLIKREG
jgi:transcription elongation factor